MKANIEKILKHIKRIDRREYCDGSLYYDKLLICSRKNFIRTVAVFIYDTGKEERRYFKKNLPADIYLKVLETLVDGDHAT